MTVCPCADDMTKQVNFRHAQDSQLRICFDYHALPVSKEGSFHEWANCRPNIEAASRVFEDLAVQWPGLVPSCSMHHCCLSFPTGICVGLPAPPPPPPPLPLSFPALEQADSWAGLTIQGVSWHSQHTLVPQHGSSSSSQLQIRLQQPPPPWSHVL